MTHGIDTDFLVAVEITDHPFHRQADELVRGLVSGGHDFALAPQTMAEFIHVVTDARRMPRPLTMVQAISHARMWWDAQEVVRVFPCDRSTADFFSWLHQHQLGWKRLLDTMLAATFRAAGVTTIVTNNARDYEVLGPFEIVGFR